MTFLCPFPVHFELGLDTGSVSRSRTLLHLDFYRELYPRKARRHLISLGLCTHILKVSIPHPAFIPPIITMPFSFTIALRDFAALDPFFLLTLDWILAGFRATLV